MSTDPENPHSQTQVNYQNSTLYRPVSGLFQVLDNSIHMSLQILSDMASRLMLGHAVCHYIIFFATLIFHNYEGFSQHTAGHKLSRPRGIG